jgi:hypothetical protein
MRGIGGLVLFVRTEIPEEKSVLLPHFQTQISNGPDLDRTRSSVMLGQRLHDPAVNPLLLMMLLNYLLHRVLERLTGCQLVKKLPTFYGTRRFITALTSARHLSLSWASYLYYMNTVDYYVQSGLCRGRWKLRSYSLVCSTFTGPPIQGSLFTNTNSVVDERKQILCFLY